MPVVLGVVLALMGVFFLRLRAQVDVNGSLNPARSAVKYAFWLLCYAVGLSLIAWFCPCRHLSAWLIGAGVMAVTVASAIASSGWGYRIPELYPVAAAVMVVFVAMSIVAWFRPTCG